VWGSRWAAIASIWPLDSTPSRHAPRVTGRWASLRARDTVAAARGRGMAARSASQAVMEVVPSSSHSPARSWAATAALMRASSRSRHPTTAARAAPSAGMSSSSMTVPSSSNTPQIVHVFASSNQAKPQLKTGFRGTDEHPPSRSKGRPQGRRSEPLTPAHPNPPQPPQSPKAPTPGRDLNAIHPTRPAPPCGQRHKPHPSRPAAARR
jgi:hypothetical protein